MGPRQSCYERLPASQDPRNEFITGVLIPRDAEDEAAREPEDEADTLGTGTDEYQDDDADEEIPVAAAPVLDPKSLPRSLGISFIVSEPEGAEPSVEICATWARYRTEKSPQDNSQIFIRVPDCYVTPEPVDVSRNQIIAEVDQVQISLRSSPIPGAQNTYKVSIYLVNETALRTPANPEEKVRVETSHLIFQPQIRVVLSGMAKLLPFDSFQPTSAVPEPGSLDEEDESLALIYRDYQAYARGHLCAAVWKEIDPERPCTGRQENLLEWVDGEVVESQYGKPQFNKFVLPHCRTEYVPCYPVQSPEIGWREGLTQQEPELSAVRLSETWNPMAMQEALQPLVDGYLTWIASQEAQISTLDSRYHRAANRHLAVCRRAAQRVQEAIALICQNEEVRLAFCFANKAISLQASWRRPGEFRWRPFQLAFVLMNIPAISDPLHQDRLTCDLLAFATGGGKTEAYLGLAAFTLGLRRLRSEQDTNNHRTGHGVSVISRYTLRLLTIQQFRRALGLIVACEVLRVHNTGTSRPAGWRPGNCSIRDSYIWGTTRFSAGLWVGGNVTPNSFKGYPHLGVTGAKDALAGKKADGEPAQVLNCPCCGTILAIPKDGLGTGTHTIHLVLRGAGIQPSLPQQIPVLEELESAPQVQITPIAGNSDYTTLSLTFTVKESASVSTWKLDGWWRDGIQPLVGTGTLVPFRLTRPGYFKRSYRGGRGAENIENFEIYCPNPVCDLNTNKLWNEKAPLPFDGQCTSPLRAPDSFTWDRPLEAFTRNTNYSSRIPIPAYTVDDQIYARIPSLLVATVDKFARLAFEPRAGSIFGNVNAYHSRTGYYRSDAVNGDPSPRTHFKAVNPLLPPDLILQDELHLIEGPLGSMVGLYETAVDTLCQRIYRGQVISPKYIASTATVRQSQSQVRCLFDRDVFQFPPPALSAADNFFALTPDRVHPTEADENDQHPSGRLYVAVCAPGKGAQTPIVRIYSSLLQDIDELRASGYSDDDCDPFWTLVGYFNAIRELAGALTLYRQDIPERLRHNADLIEAAGRSLEEAIELSSRMDSTELPGLLSSLEKSLPEARDIVLSTSMFGTGVDIDRLGLMVVNGQPKTTASYIQATGRVGRRTGGMVVAFFRASRPRDLDHYEFFTGYHRAIYRYVEPITVTPFAARARERGMGPVAVALLRQGQTIQGIPVASQWVAKSNATYMRTARGSRELDAIRELVTRRSQIQLSTRRPPQDQVDREVRAGFDRWERAADSEPTLVYEEYAISDVPTTPVVLGDEQHQQQGFTVVFRNAPSSLREVESMTRFGSISNNQQNQPGQGN